MTEPDPSDGADGDDDVPQLHVAGIPEVQELLCSIVDFASEHGANPTLRSFNLAQIGQRMGWSTDFAIRVANLAEALEYVQVSAAMFKDDAPSMTFTTSGVERVTDLKLEKALATPLERPAKKTTKDDGPTRRQQLFDVLPLVPTLKVPPVRDNFIGGHFGAAVFEAIGVLTAQLRRLSGLTNDGHKLAGDALNINGLKVKQPPPPAPPVQPTPPKVAINDLKDDNDKSQQEGVMYLAMGVYAAVRNLTNHYNNTALDEPKTVEGLAVVSLVLRHLPK